VSTLEPPVYDGQGEILKPYVPRLLIEWVRVAPEEVYRPVDGTLAFVDISGFTALTERLARRGKIGAELMRDTLDGVFRALLDEAYDWGAGLLKWGGDALLLLFDGPGHPQRAARAMWELQRTIERVGRLRAGGGTVTLRMSIGIATGTIDFFTAGSVHRELLVAGPVATETVSIEAVADAGEIGISRALAQLLEPACVGPEKDGIVLLAAPPDAVRDRAPDVGAVDGLEIAQCIPIAAREHVLLDRSEPEHRTITAAFIDLMETDALLAQLGPQAFAEALDERICAIEEAALRHDVPFYETDIGKGSVKALLTAGAPSSTGHDEEQMLRTLREVLDQDGVIPIRVGVNTGKVFTGDFGPPYRRAYRVFGDAINTAARVMSRAEAGQILATEIVLERSPTTFDTAPIEPFKAKGKAELVRASIVGPIAGRRVERRAETKLVGRDRELAALLDAVEEAREHNGWVVEISGAPGTGRSRLVRELVERCRDIRVLESRCEEYEASTPYFAFRAPMRTVLALETGADAAAAERRLRDVVARVDPSLEPWLPLLGILLGLDLAPTPETSRLETRFLRDQLADVALRFFVELLGGSTMLFAVEDAHFLDEASADLLRRLAHAAGSLPFVLVLTRAEPASLWVAPPDDDSVRWLALTLLPLWQEQAAEVVALATDDDPLPPHAVEEIARRSAGNVLFLFELVDMARATGSTEALPDSVEAVVAADIDRLAPSDRTVLRYASVLGARFDPRLLEASLRGEVELDDQLWERLRGLVDADVTGAMGFRNTLVREAAYEGLPFRRRRELHARLAQTIEASTSSPEEEASTLALHFSAAGRSAETWRYARVAGERARAVAAHVEAAKFFELALGAARHLRGIAAEERAEVLIALADACETAGLFEQAYRALCRATRIVPDDPVRQAALYALRQRAQFRQGSYTLALRETARGLRLVEGRADAPAVGARALLRSLRSEVRWQQGRARDTIKLAKAAIEDAEAVGEDRALLRAYNALDTAYEMLGQPEKAVHQQLILDLCTRLGDVRSRGMAELNLGVSAYSEGRWDESISHYERAREDCATVGDRFHAAAAGANLGEVLVSRGDYEQAEPVLIEARRTLRSAGFLPLALFAETQLARIALERGEGVAALETLRRVVDEAAATSYAGIVLDAKLWLAQAHAAAGSPEAGLAIVEEAIAEAGEEAEQFAPAADRARAACLAALGRRHEARECLRRALATAEERKLLAEQLLIVRALIGLDGAAAGAEELGERDRLEAILGVGA
jgi:class 3 adenylate cyclase/tetratricopeptide (TPR) repeat protein